jgi:hypothetical protein
VRLPLVGVDMLIGMDMITEGDFIISNYAGRTVFTFRMPSAHSFDFLEDDYLPR